MANDLTGDFDVVAEFTLGAVDRGLDSLRLCRKRTRADLNVENDGHLT